MYTLREYLSEALIKHKISNYNNYDVVDFGLSVKWLKYNLAGDKLTDDESDYGYYYQWGSTTGYPDATKHKFSWETTPYIKDFNEQTFTKYVTDSYYGDIDNKKILDPEDDAVTVLLGSKYRMPTADEYIELYKHCTGSSGKRGFIPNSLSGVASISKNGIYWVVAGTTIDGVKYKNPGCLCVGQDISKRVFFPAAGEYTQSVDNYINLRGYYWSSSLDFTDSNYSYRFYFLQNDVCSAYENFRYRGFSVRGVRTK